ncbi:hypothetical protein TELCIR_10539 [Teladorsagia circumcincta]|uniref:Uncharacterized protein n=1 Tax=Teladorsagia circumcincta TaxID=45464 RepID=A0A2G9UD80_TELCI|nr:hypothetical protein TELCIR_10539 [Teladorsagia circumcincta]
MGLWGQKMPAENIYYSSTVEDATDGLCLEERVIRDNVLHMTCSWWGSLPITQLTVLAELMSVNVSENQQKPAEDESAYSGRSTYAIYEQPTAQFATNQESEAVADNVGAVPADRTRNFTVRTGGGLIKCFSSYVSPLRREIWTIS